MRAVFHITVSCVLLLSPQALAYAIPSSGSDGQSPSVWSGNHRGVTASHLVRRSDTGVYPHSSPFRPRGRELVYLVGNKKDYGRDVEPWTWSPDNDQIQYGIEQSPLKRDFASTPQQSYISSELLAALGYRDLPAVSYAHQFRFPGGINHAIWCHISSGLIVIKDNPIDVNQMRIHDFWRYAWNKELEMFVSALQVDQPLPITTYPLRKLIIPFDLTRTSAAVRNDIKPQSEVITLEILHNPYPTNFQNELQEDEAMKPILELFSDYRTFFNDRIIMKIFFHRGFMGMILGDGKNYQGPDGSRSRMVPVKESREEKRLRDQRRRQRAGSTSEGVSSWEASSSPPPSQSGSASTKPPMSEKRAGKQPQRQRSNSPDRMTQGGTSPPRSNSRASSDDLERMIMESVMKESLGAGLGEFPERKKTESEATEYGSQPGTRSPSDVISSEYFPKSQLSKTGAFELEKELDEMEAESKQPKRSGKFGFAMSKTRPERQQTSRASTPDEERRMMEAAMRASLLPDLDMQRELHTSESKPLGPLSGKRAGKQPERPAAPKPPSTRSGTPDAEQQRLEVAILASLKGDTKATEPETRTGRLPQRGPGYKFSSSRSSTPDAEQRRLEAAILQSLKSGPKAAEPMSEKRAGKQPEQGARSRSPSTRTSTPDSEQRLLEAAIMQSLQPDTESAGSMSERRAGKRPESSASSRARISRPPTTRASTPESERRMLEAAIQASLQPDDDSGPSASRPRYMPDIGSSSGSAGYYEPYTDEWQAPSAFQLEMERIMGKAKPPPAPEVRSETPESSIRRFPFANTMDADLAAAIAESEMEEWRRLTGDAKAKGLQFTTERSASRQSQRSGGTRPSTPDPRFEYMGESSPSRTSSQSGNVGTERSEEVSESLRSKASSPNSLKGSKASSIKSEQMHAGGTGQHSLKGSRASSTSSGTLDQSTSTGSSSRQSSRKSKAGSILPGPKSDAVSENLAGKQPEKSGRQASFSPENQPDPKKQSHGGMAPTTITQSASPSPAPSTPDVMDYELENKLSQGGKKSKSPTPESMHERRTSIQFLKSGTSRSASSEQMGSGEGPPLASSRSEAKQRSERHLDEQSQRSRQSAQAGTLGSASAELVDAGAVNDQSQLSVAPSATSSKSKTKQSKISGKSAISIPEKTSEQLSDLERDKSGPSNTGINAVFNDLAISETSAGSHRRPSTVGQAEAERNPPPLQVTGTGASTSTGNQRTTNPNAPQGVQVVRVEDIPSSDEEEGGSRSGVKKFCGSLRC